MDTVVVAPAGTFEMGTAGNPIASNVTARMMIADRGPIDRARDPFGFSRGLILHGFRARRLKERSFRARRFIPRGFGAPRLKERSFRVHCFFARTFGARRLRERSFRARHLETHSFRARRLRERSFRARRLWMHRFGALTLAIMNSHWKEPWSMWTKCR